MALTGNQGKSGGGLRVASWWRARRAATSSAAAATCLAAARADAAAARRRSAAASAGATSRTSIAEVAASTAAITPLMPFLYAHGGYKEIWDQPEFHDPALPRPTADVHEGGGREGLDPGPSAAGRPTRASSSSPASNPLRRWPAPQIAQKHLWPKLDADRRRQLQDEHVGAECATSCCRPPATTSATRHQVHAGLHALRGPRREGGRAARRIEVRVGDLRPARHARSRSGRGRAASRPFATPHGRRASTSRTSTTTGRATASSTRPTPSAALDEILRNTQAHREQGLRRGGEDGRAAGASMQNGGPAPLYAARHATTSRATRCIPHARFVEEKEAVADAHRPPAVPDRPPVVRRGGRGAARTQGAAEARAATTRCASPAATRAGRSTRSGATRR